MDWKALLADEWLHCVLGSCWETLPFLACSSLKAPASEREKETLQKHQAIRAPDLPDVETRALAVAEQIANHQRCICLVAGSSLG